MARGLLDMPKVVMSKIMENIGIKAILNLRKVSHNLRNFIDDVKPDAKLEHIEISRDDNNSISVFYGFSRGHHYVEYGKHMEGCLVNKMFLKNKDFITVAMKDFGIVLGYQTSVLENLTVTAQSEINMNLRLVENVRSVLKSRDRPLKVERFAAHFMDQTQIISMLPFLDSNTLDTLATCFSEVRSDIDQLVKTDQWRSIKHIVFTTPADLKDIEHFVHFSTVGIQFESDYFPNLFYLKNLFLRSPGFEIIRIRPKNRSINDIQRSIDILGQPILDVDTDRRTKHVWYYDIPNTSQVLEISVIHLIFWSNRMIIKLSRIEENNVPRGAVIQN